MKFLQISQNVLKGQKTVEQVNSFWDQCWDKYKHVWRHQNHTGGGDGDVLSNSEDKDTAKVESASDVPGGKLEDASDTSPKEEIIMVDSVISTDNVSMDASDAKQEESTMGLMCKTTEILMKTNRPEKQQKTLLMKVAHCERYSK